MNLNNSHRAACKTLKQARERLPEFEKYPPKDVEKSPTMLPALANLVADLTKVGWPATA